LIISHNRIITEYRRYLAYLSEADAIRKTAEQLFMLEFEVEKIVKEDK